MGPETLLNELRSSELFTPGFPKRAHYTRTQWALLPEEVRQAAHEPERLALARVKNVQALAGAVRELGKARYEPAVPVLAELWAHCALPLVRTAAGEALRAIGGPEARAALEAWLEDADRMSVILAIWAIFDADASAAYERFAPYFERESLRLPGGAIVPGYVLRTFSPSARRPDGTGNLKPEWSEPRAPAWFREDRRWVMLCNRLRRDARFKHTATSALEHADPELVDLVLGDSAYQPPSAPPRTHAEGDLLARYLRGEHEEVWRILREPEAIAGDFREEALAVARETMRRVARAVDVLSARLSERGWRVWLAGGAPRTPPAAGDAALLATLVTLTKAPLPPSLQAFWEVVGGINFIWDDEHGDEAPDLGTGLAMNHMDPLAMPAAGELPDIIDEWGLPRDEADSDDDEPIRVCLSGDELMKAGISGSTYGIELPFAGADPMVLGYMYDLNFVDYLRHCIEWAGFPGLAIEAEPRIDAFVSELTRDLEPF
ncbi:HEAT repeat domain-containing protein [Pyxidicoccus xibeiensis]|uniref:HEAT repeat domain-containing protein n=1 Tax=Pyxidicoccus xibeiensis TaxID=2906759 RepID=UPI0020A735C8|nr:HEAT repeat domain-containing protein [Pyxidicoccus xibeiensis]MCP3143813.1 HEAT repeat domain-containing protein [Pyxidicoccus xibeiensis]